MGSAYSVQLPPLPDLMWQWCRSWAAALTQQSRGQEGWKKHSGLGSRCPLQLYLVTGADTHHSGMAAVDQWPQLLTRRQSCRLKNLSPVATNAPLWGIGGTQQRQNPVEAVEMFQIAQCGWQSLVTGRQLWDPADLESHCMPHSITEVCPETEPTQTQIDAHQLRNTGHFS